MISQFHSIVPIIIIARHSNTPLHFTVDTEGVMSFVPGEMISLDVTGNPLPLKRPIWLNRHHIFNPSRAKQEQFRQAVKATIGGSLTTPIFQSGVPLYVRLKFVMTGAVRNADVDNLQKFVFDALRGVIYDDDRDIFKVTAVKSLDTSFRRLGRTRTKPER